MSDLPPASESDLDWETASGTILTDGHWRFTAMSDRLIRIEYDEARRWVDEATIAFVRAPPQGAWTHRAAQRGGWVHLRTSRVTVRYRADHHPASGTVHVTSRADHSHAWAWGDDPAEGNLFGTARTLDSLAETLDLNCHHRVSKTVENPEMHCTWGLVSRRGWAVVNDTGKPIWHDGWYAPSRNSVDVSVFLHGLDFAGAMKDFFHAAGPPPVPPRYAFGSLFSRWYNFDSDSVMALVNDFESRSMPLDAWIFDMNWHRFGPWGSYTWNEDSYPKLEELQHFLRSRGLAVGANMHDRQGIAKDEATFSQVRDKLGVATSKDVPFRLYDKDFAMALEDVTMRALETKDGKQGIDFPWIDYQQGEYDTFEGTHIPNLNPTIVLNALRFTDPGRRGENHRPLILSRWGGLGNHRYPIGFSGDQKHSWQGLAFLPYFTSTAANVGFNFWSHDTVGGSRGRSRDFELSVRWVQTSAWSPVLRFHDKGAGTGDCASSGSCARVIPWDLPSAFFAPIREAMQMRSELVPYIYTAAFLTVETGLALVRPMYYEDPSDPKLYGLEQQYLFGLDMIISPITRPSSNEKGSEQALSAISWRVYAPRAANSEDDSRGWVDRLNGDFANGRHVRSVYGISDVPGLIRQGSIIPMRPRYRSQGSLGKAKEPLDTIEFRLAPADAFYSGGTLRVATKLIDDDGLTLDYTRGSYATIHCKYVFEDRAWSLMFSQEGSFTTQPKKLLAVKLSFPQLPPVTVASIGGLGTGMSSEYDHRLLGTVLTFVGVDFTSKPFVHVKIDEAYPDKVLPQFVGTLGRIRRARYVKDALDELNVPYGDGRAKLTAYVLAATHMSPNFAETLTSLWEEAVEQVAQALAGNWALRNDPRRARFIRQMLQLERLTEWECAHWDDKDKTLLQDDDSTDRQRAVCQRADRHHGWAYRFTQGDDSQASGCSGCWCCRAALKQGNLREEEDVDWSPREPRLIRWATTRSKCLDVSPGHKPSSLQLFDCHPGHHAQHFFVPETVGQIRWASNPDHCLDVEGGHGRPGTIVQVKPCHTWKASQRFAVDPDQGLLHWAGRHAKDGELCLDIAGGRKFNGNRIQIWGCSNTTKSMQFEFPFVEDLVEANSVQPIDKAFAGALPSATAVAAAASVVEMLAPWVLALLCGVVGFLIGRRSSAQGSRSNERRSLICGARDAEEAGEHVVEFIKPTRQAQVSAWRNKLLGD